MSAFVPPYPPRLAGHPSVFRRVMLARRDVLEMWEEPMFEVDFVHTRVLMRKCFLCNSPESVQFAFSLKNASFERKSPQMRHALEPLIGDGLFISDGETWRQRRRAVAPIVHVSRLAKFAPEMVAAATERRDRWTEHEGSTIDALSECAELTAEVICRALFGRRLGHDYAHQIVAGFSKYQEEIDRIDLISLFGLPDWLPRRRNATLRRAVKNIHAVLDDVIASCRADQAAKESSVIGQLLDATDNDAGAPMSHEAVRNEIAVLFMAGHETTANSLAWTWYLLSQVPEVEAKLHAEIDSVLQGRAPTLQDVPKLPYTRAVFEEALRLYPPVPVLPREAVRDEEFRGTKIPKGSWLFVVPWILHRHKKLWDKPDHFIPERFLGAEADRISKFQYIPFSIGPRVCAGMAFGLTEAILCLAVLGQKLQLRLVPGTDVQPACRLTLRPRNGLPMIVEGRTKFDYSAERHVPEHGIKKCPVHHA